MPGEYTPFTVVVDQVLDDEMIAMARIKASLEASGLDAAARARIVRWAASKWGGDHDGH